ncbi:MAG: shikimate dehydrogenase [Parvularculaceae bacterium]
MAHLAKEKPRLAGVVGWPVSHSLSPLIHSTWAAREGIDARYDAIAAAPDDAAFTEKIGVLRAEGYRGVNVTIPHKERAFRIADTVSDAARSIGAANMLTFVNEEIIAENSDATAVVEIIESLEPRPQTALTLGAGGAARGVLWALNKAGLSRVIIANRTRARAAEIAPIANAETIDWNARGDALDKADLIINTTSLGMNGEPPLELDHARMKPDAIVFDLVYSPLETALLSAARARGLRTIDGLEMLMRQAAPAYRRWLGAKAEVDADLRKRLETALKARGR